MAESPIQGRRLSYGTGHIVVDMLLTCEVCQGGTYIERILLHTLCYLSCVERNCWSYQLLLWNVHCSLCAARLCDVSRCTSILVLLDNVALQAL